MALSHFCWSPAELRTNLEYWLMAWRSLRGSGMGRKRLVCSSSEWADGWVTTVVAIQFPASSNSGNNRMLAPGKFMDPPSSSIQKARAWRRPSHSLFH